MANAALEKFVLKLSVAVFLIAFVLVLVLLSPSLRLALFGLSGYVLSIFLFESTAALYGSLNGKTALLKILAILFLLGTFSVLLLGIWFSLQQGMTAFWSYFTGLMSIPATVIIYIVLEAVGVLHTDFFT